MNIQHECPWCERIFTLEHGRHTYTVNGKVLICETCYDVHMQISQTGAWVDGGKAIQEMIDSGLLVEWKPEPGELDKPVEALAKYVEDLVWQQLINKEKDE